MSSLAQGDDKVTKDLLFIGKANVNAVDRWGNNVVKYSFLSPPSRKLLAAVAPQRIGSNMQAKQSTLGILTGNPAKDEQSQQSTIDGQESSTISKDNDKELEINCTDRDLFVVLSGGADVSTCDADGNYPCTGLQIGTLLVYFSGIVPSDLQTP